MEGMLVFGFLSSSFFQLTNIWSLLALISTVVAAVLIHLKKDRLQALLKHIEKLPEARRLEAVKQELNQVPPPKMFAEQYIQYKLIPYNFAFKILLMVLVVGIIGILCYNIPAVIGPQSKDPSVSITSTHSSAQKQPNNLAQTYSFKDRFTGPSFNMPSPGKLAVRATSNVCQSNNTMLIGIFPEGDDFDPFMPINQCGGVSVTGELPAGNYHVVLMKNDDGATVKGVAIINYLF